MTVDPGGSGSPMSERMQSLLSRAVEDQLTEQRQLAGVLSELRAQLARMADELTALRAGGSGAGGADALAGVSTDLREAVRLLAERLDGVARLVQERGRDLAELKASVGEVQAALRTQGDALGSVTGGLAALPAFGERIGGLQDNLAGMQQRLAAVDEAAGAVGAMQQHVDAVGQELRELRSAFAGIAARVADLPARADLNNALARTGERVDELAATVARIESAVGELAERAPAAGPDSAESAAGGAEALEALRAELARFAGTVTDDAERTHERLDRLDEALAGLSEQLEGEPDEAVEMADLDEVEEEEEDPVLVELSELRADLFGPGGLRDRLTERLGAADHDQADNGMAAAVAEAVEAVEARLTAHMDEAVLALAEALLRRRGSRPPSASVTPAPPVPAPEPSYDDEPGEVDAAEVDADEAPTGEAEAEEVDEAPGDEAPDVEAPVDENGAAAPGWQTPPAPLPPAEPGRRRRPWWRPGD